MECIKLKEWFTVEYIISHYKDINYMKVPPLAQPIGRFRGGTGNHYYLLISLFAELPFKLLIKVISKYQDFSLETWQRHILKNTVKVMIKNKQYLVYSFYELYFPLPSIINYRNVWQKFSGALAMQSLQSGTKSTNNQTLWNNNYNFLCGQVINVEQTYVYIMSGDIGKVYTIDIYDHIDTKTFLNAIIQFKCMNNPEFGILRALIRLKRIFEQQHDPFYDLYVDHIIVREYDEDTLIHIVNYLLTKCNSTSCIFETIQQFNIEYGYSFNL